MNRQQAYRQRREELLGTLREKVARMKVQFAANLQEKKELQEFLDEVRKENEMLKRRLGEKSVGDDEPVFSFPYLELRNGGSAG